MMDRWGFSAATLKSSIPRSTLDNSQFLHSSFATPAITSSTSSVPSNLISESFDQPSSPTSYYKRRREEEIEETNDRLSRSEGDSTRKRIKTVPGSDQTVLSSFLTPLRNIAYNFLQFFSPARNSHHKKSLRHRFKMEEEEDIEEEQPQQNEEENSNLNRTPSHKSQLIGISPISKHNHTLDQSMDRSILDQSIGSQLNDSFRELSVIDELKREKKTNVLLIHGRIKLQTNRH